MSTIRARHAPRPAAPRDAAASPATRAGDVIVVTHDTELEGALREASPATTMVLATTPAELADLLMSGRGGALVVDIGALGAAAITVARHLAEQFPDVPLVAVGSREDEARLAGLISGGLVYRFLHRPLSAARARTFIDAALRRGGQIGSGARPSATPASRHAPPRSRWRLALAATGAAAMLGFGLWLALRPPPAPPPAAHRPATAAAAIERRSPPAPSVLPMTPVLPESPTATILPAATADGATANAAASIPVPSEIATPVVAPDAPPAADRETASEPAPAATTEPPPDARPGPPPPPAPEPAAPATEPGSQGPDGG